MSSNPNEDLMKHWMEKIDEVVGKDWSAPRARLYIVANLQVLDKALKELQKKYEFESEVNKRVQLVVAELLAANSEKPQYPDSRAGKNL